LDETRSVIEASRTRRNGVRWQLALAIGLRQGEALGLQWDDIDLDAATLRVRRTLGRAPWKHGCQIQECGQRAWQCPKRHGGGLVVATPKTMAGIRIVALPGFLADQLGLHRRAQATEQFDVGADWPPPPARGGLNTGSGWVFTTRIGGPVDPARDWKDWKQLLSEAKVAEYRVHDARHSAATFMLQAGVDTSTVMDTLGWVQPAMLVRYQHVPDRLRRQAAERIDRLLWAGT
jgi:integrase